MLDNREEDEAELARGRMRINAVAFALFAFGALFLPRPWSALGFILLMLVAAWFIWLHIWGSDQACIDVRRGINQIMLIEADRDH